jgi:hypothetical protein
VWKRSRRGFKAPCEARGAFLYDASQRPGLRAMSLPRPGKAIANEQKYPFIIAVPVAANGLDVELNNQIVGFHKSRRIPPKFGRSMFRDGQTLRAHLSNSSAVYSTKRLALNH